MKRLIFIAVTAALLSGPVMAAISLPGTGAPPSVVTDAHYLLYPVTTNATSPVGVPGSAFLTARPTDRYPADTGYSWIGPTSTSGTTNPSGGYYWYQLNAGQVIVNTGSQTGLYHFEGDWASDNDAALFTDGGTLTQVATLDFGVAPNYSFGVLTHFSFDANVNYGEALLFRVNNVGDNPTGLLVENFSATFVPLPGAVLLGMLGLGVAGLKLRKAV